jgi:hypothetical protein
MPIISSSAYRLVLHEKCEGWQVFLEMQHLLSHILQYFAIKLCNFPMLSLAVATDFVLLA